MKKRILSLLLGAALCVSLSGVALADETNDPVFGPQPPTVTQPTPPPSPPPAPPVDSGGSGWSDSGRAVSGASGSATGGSWTSSASSAKKGDTVTVTAKPKSGYEVKSVTVTDSSGKTVTVTALGGNKYSFVMPDGSVTVSVEFALIPTAPKPAVSFSDVPASAYYADAVAWAVENGVTNGMGDGTFGSNLGCTRAQFVTFLYRAAGSPAVSGAAKGFSDVSATAHASYYNAILWAVEQGVTMGTGDGSTFSPDAVVTRAQSVTFMHRYAQKAGIATRTGAADFDDVSNTGAMAPYYDAIGWAVANGITNGNSTDANTFGPMDDCVRANMITFLYRLFTGARA